MSWSMYRNCEDIGEFIDLIKDLEKLGFKRADGKTHKNFMPFVEGKTGIEATSRHEIYIHLVASEGMKHLFKEKYQEYD